MFPVKLLDRGEFAERQDRLAPSIHLTLISIVQAVAFGFLANTLTRWTPHWDCRETLRAVLLLEVIVLILYESFWYVGVLSYGFGFFDSLMPLVIGLFEALAAAHLRMRNDSAWWICATALCIALVGGLMNLRINHLTPDRLLPKARRLSYRKLRGEAGCLVILAVVSAFFAGHHRSLGRAVCCECTVLGLMMASGVVVTLRSRHCRKKIYCALPERAACRSERHEPASGPAAPST